MAYKRINSHVLADLTEYSDGTYCVIAVKVRDKNGMAAKPQKQSNRSLQYVNNLGHSEPFLDLGAIGLPLGLKMYLGEQTESSNTQVRTQPTKAMQTQPVSEVLSALAQITATLKAQGDAITALQATKVRKPRQQPVATETALVPPSVSEAMQPEIPQS